MNEHELIWTKVPLGHKSKSSDWLFWPYTCSGIPLAPGGHCAWRRLHPCVISILESALLNKLLRGTYGPATLSSARTLNITLINWNWKGTSRETWSCDWKPSFAIVPASITKVVWDRFSSGYTIMVLMGQLSRHFFHLTLLINFRCLYLWCHAKLILKMLVRI